MKTLTLLDGTILVVRQIAAVLPIRQQEEVVDIMDEGEEPPIPKVWYEFSVVFVGGTKLYPPIEYGSRPQAQQDRDAVISAIKIGDSRL